MKKILILILCVINITGCAKENDIIVNENNYDDADNALEEEVVIKNIYIEYNSETDFFELPINGATGFATIDINLRSENSSSSSLVTTVAKGSTFVILEENYDWLKVNFEGNVGYVFADYVMINLPDVVPSAVYNNTNASASVLKSSYIDLPSITGVKLYDAHSFNERLGYEEYIIPVLYNTAKKIAQAQDLAIQDGNTLVIYELYRPFEVQQKIVTSLKEASNSNDEIRKGITLDPWSIGWFISTTLSNHQRGIAIDTSLAKIIETEVFTSGNYKFDKIKSYEEYEMQTPIHELSYRSASLSYPISSTNDETWKSVPSHENFTESSLLLRGYTTQAGLIPLASEWWHFDDLDSKSSSKSVGDFYTENIVSIPPVLDCKTTDEK